MKNTLKFIPSLTGYRAIAAWIVFIYHFFPFNSDKYPILIKNIVHQFHFGVDMFFVLSGFLITYRYYSQVKINFRHYMINRFARIYPMYIILTLFVFLVGIIKTGYWNVFKSIEFLTSITMTKALFRDFFFSGIPQGWTLTLEELFYISAPIFFILIKKTKYYLLYIPFTIIILGFLLEVITNNPSNTYGFLQTKIYLHIIEFFAGILLAYLIFNKDINLETKSSYFTYIGILVISIYLVGIQFIEPYIDLKSIYGRIMELIFVSVLGIVPLLYGLIFEKTIISKFLSSKLMVMLGKSSYAFYLIHKGWIPILINDYIIDNKLVLFIILNLISIGLFYWIEEPLNKFIRSRYKQKNLRN